MPGVTGDGDRYLIRPATEADLDAIAAFEVEIAVVSFGDEAITDAAFHRRRVANSLRKPGEIALVAADDPEPTSTEPARAVPASSEPSRPEPARTGSVSAGVLGWAWMSGRTNSLTGARYGNFRSLAVADHPDQGVISELLMTAILAAADEAGFTHLTGKVNAGNHAMRTLYRAFGVTATHLTMEKRTGRERNAEAEKGSAAEKRTGREKRTGS
jgi:RimJ/RimL family protein N-acetyltransferase